MPVFSALIWAACCAGAQAAVIQHEIRPHRELSDRWQWSLLAAAGAVGAVGGWFAALRTAAALDQLRLLLVMAALCAAAGVDLTRRRIPNLLSVLLLAGFAVCTALDFLLRRERAAGLLLAGVLISRGGIGMGDIKLFSALSLLLGLYGGMCTLILAQLAALVCAVVLLLARKATLKDSIPFAPFFAVGFLLCLILGTY